jgi:hypothetical protein
VHEKILGWQTLRVVAVTTDATVRLEPPKVQSAELGSAVLL